jgi:hypothetical protein
MAILSDYLGAMNRNQPVVGSGSSSISSNLFVMNTNAMTANTHPDDPYWHVHGSTGDDNIRPIVVPDMGFYLELNVAFLGTIPAVDTPVVRVFGQVPYNGDELKRYWPYDVNTSMVGSSNNGATDSEVTNAFWVPLVDWDATEYQAAADAAEVDHDSKIALFGEQYVALDSGDASPGIKMGVPRRVALTGCTKVICTIVTAAANADAAMIVGRFIG